MEALQITKSEIKRKVETEYQRNVVELKWGDYAEIIRPIGDGYLVGIIEPEDFDVVEYLNS